MKLVFATHNNNKLNEVKDLLSNSFEILSLKDIGFNEEIIEEKKTIIENSKIKCIAVKQKTGYDCFADDTGLEVEALNGAPGVYSARYAGENCSYHDNVLKLLEVMKGEKNRKAVFRTVLALVNLVGEVRTIEGVCKGTISLSESGISGFGYDPIFVPDGYRCTFADLELSEKNKISHRGLALQEAIRLWGSIFRQFNS